MFIDCFAEMLIRGRNAYTALPIAIIAHYCKIEKTDEKISSRMANILSWIAAALLGAASAVVLALLVWNGFLYLEYLRQPPLARPFSHGSFAPVGDDDDWTFKPQFAEERRRSLRFFWRLSNALWPHRRCPHSPDCCSGMRRRCPCYLQARSAKGTRAALSRAQWSRSMQYVAC